MTFGLPGNIAPHTGDRRVPRPRWPGRSPTPVNSCSRSAMAVTWIRPGRNRSDKPSGTGVLLEGSKPCQEQETLQGDPVGVDDARRLRLQAAMTTSSLRACRPPPHEPSL
jgi:hypothetical protein